MNAGSSEQKGQTVSIPYFLETFADVLFAFGDTTECQPSPLGVIDATEQALLESPLATIQDLRKRRMIRRIAACHLRGWLAQFGAKSCAFCGSFANPVKLSRVRQYCILFWTYRGLTRRDR